MPGSLKLQRLLLRALQLCPAWWPALKPYRTELMPRYVFNLIVGDQKYVIDDHGMEIDTLH